MYYTSNICQIISSAYMMNFIIPSFEKISTFEIRIEVQSILILNKFILNVNQLIMIIFFPKNHYVIIASSLRIYYVTIVFLIT